MVKLVIREGNFFIGVWVFYCMLVLLNLVLLDCNKLLKKNFNIVFLGEFKIILILC